jgi:thiosulfate dehydrogenase (quinone) large subunit
MTSRARRPPNRPRPASATHAGAPKPLARRRSVLDALPPRATELSGWALLPLRAFLGVTFCFAGLQKLANPNFFNAADPSGMHAQLIAASRSSPLGGLLSHLVDHSTPLGLLIALSELAVGIGTLLGLWARIAACGGAALSLTLFLTVSYHSSPYYTGADIIFLFAWLPLIVAGAGPLSVDAWIARRAGAEHGRLPEDPVVLPFSAVQSLCGQYDQGRCRARRNAPCAIAPCPVLNGTLAPSSQIGDGQLSRRELMLGAVATGVAGLAGIATAGAAAGIGRAIGASPSPTPSVALPENAAPRTTTTQPPSTSTSAGASTTTTSSVPTPPGRAIGAASSVPVGGAATFRDPQNGLRSIVVQLQKGQFVAYDAVCPHAGCTVGYSPSQHLLVCPCHGSEFNPANGDVEQGPAARGLNAYTIAEGPDGQLYVVA